jgi:hypothetical protein
MFSRQKQKLCEKFGKASATQYSTELAEKIALLKVFDDKFLQSND